MSYASAPKILLSTPRTPCTGWGKSPAGEVYWSAEWNMKTKEEWFSVNGYAGQSSAGEMNLQGVS